MSSPSDARLIARLLTAVSSRDVALCTWVSVAQMAMSSAYIKLLILLGWLSMTSAMYSVNSSGLRTPPCGTPILIFLVISVGLPDASRKLNSALLPESSSAMKLRGLFEIPRFESLLIRMSGRTLSNADSMSMSAAAVDRLFKTPVRAKMARPRILSMVDLYLRKPDWCAGNRLCDSSHQYSLWMMSRSISLHIQEVSEMGRRPFWLGFGMRRTLQVCHSSGKRLSAYISFSMSSKVSFQAMGSSFNI
ncbi:hypothetical protein ANTPLA_LOCUS3942 [Anthophora plagiata]